MNNPVKFRNFRSGPGHRGSNRGVLLLNIMPFLGWIVYFRYSFFFNLNPQLSMKYFQMFFCIIFNLVWSLLPWKYQVIFKRLTQFWYISGMNFEINLWVFFISNFARELAEKLISFWSTLIATQWIFIF